MTHPLAALIADVPRYGIDIPMMFESDVLAALEGKT